MRRLMVILLSTFILASFLGCGGGSSGTDGGVSLRVAGRVKSLSGAPIKEVTITIKETGDRAVTDGDGKFQIDTRTADSVLNLLLEKDQREITTSIDVNSAADGDTLNIELELDEASFEVGNVSVTINDPNPSPTPNPTGNLEINGNLTTESGRGIPNFRVQVERDRAYNSTDGSGRFRLTTKQRKVVLVVSNKKHRERVTLPPIESSATKIYVSIELVFEKSSNGGIQAMDESSFRLKARVRN